MYVNSFDTICHSGLGTYEYSLFLSVPGRGTWGKRDPLRGKGQ